MFNRLGSRDPGPRQVLGLREQRQHSGDGDRPLLEFVPRLVGEPVRHAHAVLDLGLHLPDLGQ
eukprot:10252671-Alexandrium_andersonii.AAC.1